MDKKPTQSFDVKDIRRIRDEDSARYEGMTYAEITQDIHERAEEVRAIKERIRKEKAARRGA